MGQVVKSFILILTLNTSWAAVEKGFFDKVEQRFKESSPKDYFSIVQADPLQLIDPNFSIDPYFLDSTKFWFNIYTYFHSYEKVLHDREHLSLVYGSINLLEELDLTPSQRTSNYQQSIKNSLEKLMNGKTDCAHCASILKSFQIAGLKIPKNNIDKKEFFEKRIESLRFQTGQKDQIIKAFDNLLPFESKIKRIIELFEIPKQIIALSFLESSFNVNARSRVGAAGVWQFMKRTGQHYMIVTPKNDHRLNPLLSSLSAFQLLKQNRKILGRWDLAIWGYNSGTSPVLKAKKQLEKPNLSLAQMLENFESENIKFASTNFYSSFLALVHAIAYREYLYPAPQRELDFIDPNNLEFYVALCNFRPSWFFSVLETNSPFIKELNGHLRSRYYKTLYPRGTILISDRKLTEKRYYKVPEKNYLNRYTRNWRNLIQSQSCSTK